MLEIQTKSTRPVRNLGIDIADVSKRFDSMDRRITRMRKQMNLTRAQLAREVNIGLTYLSRIEKGTQEPSVKVLRAIAIELDVSIDYLCCLTDVKTMNYDD